MNKRFFLEMTLKCSVDVTNAKECRQLNYGIMESVDFWRIQVYGLARRWHRL